MTAGTVATDAVAALHPIDAAVLIVYLLGITLLGIWTSRSVRRMDEFFMPRRFGVLSMIMHAFGTGTASDQAVSVASGTAQRGISGIWYQWLWLIPTPFYWLMAPMLRRFRAVTTADVLSLRFDRSVAVLFAVVGIGSMSVKIGVMLKGASAVLEAGSGGLVPAAWGIGAITVLFVLYGTAGGLGAAIVTDVIQGFLTLLFSFMLLPFVLSAVGGIEGIRSTIDDPALLSLVAPGKITAFFIVMMGVQALAGIISQPHVMGACAAGKTEWEGRTGFMVGNLVKRLCTIAWCLTAIAAVAWYLQQGVSLETIRSKEFADQIYGRIAYQFFPELMPGLLGVFLASLLAAVMSSCDSFMISSSGLFTENIYRQLRPEKSDRHYLMVGRVAGLFVVAGGGYFAFRVSGVVKALEIWFMIAPMTGIALWISLFWRRMTVAGAWATALVGFAAWYATTRPEVIQWAANLPDAAAWRFVWTEGDRTEIYTPWQILSYMSAATLAGILVSLVTPRVADERLDHFHRLMITPIVPGEVVTKPCTLPAGAVTPERPMLIQRWDLEIPRPSRTSVQGFLFGCVASAGLVAGAWAVFSW
jgi:Na+/proline symporter